MLFGAADGFGEEMMREGGEDTSGPIVLLYVFDLAGFRAAGGAGFWEERGDSFCQRRKEGKFETLNLKERVALEGRGWRDRVEVDASFRLKWF